MAEYISKDELMQYLEPLTNTPGIVIKRYVENMPTVELEVVKDVVVPNLEKHNIKRAYPDMTDGEVAAYILGFNEHEKLNMGRCYIDNEGYERCSVCNEHETGMRYFLFCPRCGVKLKH